ncbi:mersacidin family lantibiotic [Paenibacillus sp. UMB7766-LJ446]|uniref:Cytolysin CylL component n=1 Tax=Paenibacillus pabuli TaxID=1472 RepID=A0A855XYK9_9BACL|nr:MULTISPECIES: mersacidin family lantibiotic [Paenibacillus]MDK8192962.1 mersacidin family lantibiotic [Paenibacillus sp. UMB7766-LJ446]MDN8592891.1 mersacidin family lantibiotic [Paenibacillus sp. 11B]OZQ67383.1 type 2 lantibiotic [Paenibacillus taichungensis]PWW42197.1 cytolysin CylL component [Paenibacillus pabuli]PXW07585.1 cytolysin CylL component [Paenibacillus taichungensis]
MKREDVLNALESANPAGEALVELSHAELSRVFGGGDVQPETTPVCAVAATVAASSATCAAVGGGIAVGVTIVLTIKSC